MVVAEEDLGEGVVVEEEIWERLGAMVVLIGRKDGVGWEKRGGWGIGREVRGWRSVD